MNMHNPPPGVREIWRSMRYKERKILGTYATGAALVTCGVSMLLGLPGFLVCCGVVVLICAYVSED